MAGSPRDKVAQGREALRAGDAFGARSAFSAHAAFRSEDDGPGAVRSARTLGYLYGTTTGDWAIAGGWIAQAKTLLVDDPDSSERGWISLTEGMFEEVRAVKQRHYTIALDIGRARSDTDLVFCTSAYLGASLVHEDRVEEGMMLLDVALAAVADREYSVT